MFPGFASRIACVMQFKHFLWSQREQNRTQDNLNVCNNTGPVTDATVFAWFLSHILQFAAKTYTIVSAPSETGSIFIAEILTIVGTVSQLTASSPTYSNINNYFKGQCHNIFCHFFNFMYRSHLPSGF